MLALIEIDCIERVYGVVAAYKGALRGTSEMAGSHSTTALPVNECIRRANISHAPYALKPLLLVFFEDLGHATSRNIPTCTSNTSTLLD